MDFRLCYVLAVFLIFALSSRNFPQAEDNLEEEEEVDLKVRRVDDQEEECTSEPIYIYPNPKNCSTFYKCLEGRLYPIPCPETLVFNKELMVCDWAWNVTNCVTPANSALAYKGVDYETRVVNLSKDETRDPEFLKVNPAGHIPALIVNGQVLAQSMAIMEYLEETYPEKPLLPKDPLKRAKVREICEMIISEVQPMTHRKVAGKYSQDPTKKLEWQHFFLNKGLTGLEKILESCHGKYCVGDELSLADCCLVPQIYNTVYRFKMDISPFPVIQKINENILKLEVFREAHAENQKD